MEHYKTNIDPQRLKELSRTSPSRTFAALALDWGIIVAAILVSEHFQNLVVYLLAVLVIAGRMHALAVLMHEFTHYRVLSDKNASDWLGDLLTAWPIGATVASYRTNHLAHHRHTNTDNDPDWVAKRGNRKFIFPMTARGIAMLIAGYFVVIESVIDLRSILVRVNDATSNSGPRKWGRLAFYLAVVLAVALSGAWRGFVIYWLVPYLTAFMFFVYVRSVAEHFASMDYSHELGSTRTVRPHFWENWFFSPHNINYHLEHHLFPGVPFFNLPALHKELAADSEYSKHAHLTRGYTTGLVRECLA